MTMIYGFTAEFQLRHMTTISKNNGEQKYNCVLFCNFLFKERDTHFSNRPDFSHMG
jgi:hypothetical protein